MSYVAEANAESKLTVSCGNLHFEFAGLPSVYLQCRHQKHVVWLGVFQDGVGGKHEGTVEAIWQEVVSWKWFATALVPEMLCTLISTLLKQF